MKKDESGSKLEKKSSMNKTKDNKENKDLDTKLSITGRSSRTKLVKDVKGEKVETKPPKKPKVPIKQLQGKVKPKQKLGLKKNELSKLKDLRNNMKNK